MTMQQDFLDAIARDRYDQVTRLVYADWLDEHDLPELAAEQRRWTSEWQKAEDYLKAFAVGCVEGENETPESVFLEIVDTCRYYSITGATSLVGGFLGFGATNAWDYEKEEEFWTNWKVYSRSEREAPHGCPFRCCY